MLESTLETAGQSLLVGPTNSNLQSGSLYKAVHLPDNLDRAWKKVQENGLKSNSRTTKEETRQFSIHARKHLNCINKQLRLKRFRFGHARGVLGKKKSGKAERPIVIAPILSRIVQRAILDVIQSIPAIRQTLTSGFNFGGVPGIDFGVPHAIAKAIQASKESRYYIRTDIKSFFMAVPRQRAVALITTRTDDNEFNLLLDAATTTELKDLESFGDKAKLFPLWEDGVAQGSCLSPLLCNLLLSEFDEQMNQRGIVCIRYIDDFILFAPSRKSAFKAFDKCLLLLRELELSAYDPLSSEPEEQTKANHGPSDHEFTFLGCDIKQGRFRPTSTKRNDLMRKIHETFAECLESIAHPRDAIFSKTTYADAVMDASNIIRGWGNTYSFCNDPRLILNLDRDLQNMFSKFQSDFRQRIRNFKTLDRARSFGFYSLKDCKGMTESTGQKIQI